MVDSIFQFAIHLSCAIVRSVGGPEITIERNGKSKMSQPKFRSFVVDSLPSISCTRIMSARAASNITGMACMLLPDRMEWRRSAMAHHVHIMAWRVDMKNCGNPVNFPNQLKFRTKNMNCTVLVVAAQSSAPSHAHTPPLWSTSFPSSMHKLTALPWLRCRQQTNQSTLVSTLRTQDNNDKI